MTFFNTRRALLHKTNIIKWRILFLHERSVSSGMAFDTIRSSEIIDYIGSSNVLIIDLRNKEAYNAGHIPTAINIPYEDLEYNKRSLSKQYLLVFYCARGHISLMAARDLVKDGYNIKSLYGGIRAYHGTLEKSID